MTCTEIEDHVIKVNFDADFICEKCRSIFWLRKRQYNPDYSYIEEVKVNLTLRFGTHWEWEWFKLSATKEILRKIRFKRPAKKAMQIQLNEHRLYSFEDLLGSMEELKENER